MRIELICIGQKMPDWVRAGYQEYAKRLPHECSLHLTELVLPKRSKNANIPQLQREEGESMLAALPKQVHVVALDERGHAWDTLQLSKQLAQWMQEYAHVALFVGGPDGLADSCLQRAQQRWSLSPLTMPHPLVRIILAEQLYRAWSLLNNHPYHRA